jgi:ATP synthase in type III secretion protein N
VSAQTSDERVLPADSDDPLLRALSRRDTLQHVGRVAEAYGTLVRATGVRAAIGELCLLEQGDTG